MDRFEIYSLVLCLTVLVGLVALFVFFINNNVKQRLKLIRYGDEDQEIKTEYNKTKKKPSVLDLISKIFSILVTVLLCVVFAFSIYINSTEEKSANGIPSLKVVRSASMSYKNSQNTYLEINELNNQIQVHDLIITRHLPDEFDLELYDIVVYQAENGDMIIHRIVEIEEPNAKHPEHRHFKLQGDAIMYPDTYPVLYSQMRGIYVGERLPFAGSVVTFMQSPAGYFCLALILLTMIALPILEKKIANEKSARYAIICQSEENTSTETEIKIPEIENLELVEAKEEQNISDAFSFSDLKGRRDDKSFEEKLSLSNDIVKERYNSVDETLRRIVGARIIIAKKQRSYKVGNVPIAKLAFRGKTLNAFIGLDPSEYKDSKYVFIDLSSVKSHANYPMRLKLSSSRQTKWANELISELANKRGFTLLKVNPFAHLEGRRDDRSFDEKIKNLLVAKERFDEIAKFLNDIDGIRVIEGKKSKTYKLGNVPLVKFKLRGKTLNAYIALNPKKYKDTKYIYVDYSKVKSYKNYPMRVKATSNRQVKWIKELILETLKGEDL